MKILQPAPLTREGFRPFGEVIEMEGSAHYTINQGFTERFNDLCFVDVAMEGGSTNVSLFLGQPLGSQAFVPLQDQPWLVLVAGDPLDFASYRAFTATGQQGVNYARNVWHHPLLVLDADSRFIIIDRLGPGNNLEEVWLGEDEVFDLTP